MSFETPTFNLLCGVYTPPWITRTLRNAALPCNLALGRRVSSLGALVQLSGPSSVAPQLLVPAGSDVRDVACGTGADVIECPAGSGRWYQCQGVDDVGKGFPNEYRIVAITKVWEGTDPAEYSGLFWPIPIP